MSRIIILISVLLCVLAVACAAPRPNAPNAPLTASPTAAPAKSGTIRIDVPADADVADIPWLMAIDSLEEQGYTTETISFSSAALSVTAMTQGDIDMATTTNQVAWAAVGKGAPVASFMDKAANTSMIITGQDVQTCADWDGKSVAIPNVSSVSGVLFNTYMEMHCPDTQPEAVMLSGGSNRTAALLAGAVDAAAQDLDDLIRIEQDRPGDFRVTIDFAQEFPRVHIYSYAMSRDFAEQHPEIVKDVIRAVLTARRSLQDPQVLRDAISKYMELEPDRAQQMADTYLAQEVWDVSGAHVLEMVQATLDFLQTQGTLPAELSPEDVADLSYLDAVVDEIGPPESASGRLSAPGDDG